MAVTELDETASASRPQTPRFHAKQERILSAAAEVFNAHGIRGGTLAHVAARVGLATSSVTYYYPKRDALAAVCLMRSVEALQTIIRRAAQEPDVTGRIRRLFSLHLELLASIETGAHPALMHFNDTKALAHPHAGPVFKAYVAMAGDVRGLLLGPQTSHLTKEQLQARGFWLLSLLQWSRMCVGGQEPSRFGYVAQRLSELVLRGIAGSSSGWRPPEDVSAFWSRSARAHPAMGDPFLRSASMLVNEHGHRGASLDRISAALRLTKGALYRRCDTKDELIVACFDRTAQVNALAWDRAEARESCAWDRLTTGLVLLLWFQLSEFGPALRATATTACTDASRQAAIRGEANLTVQRVANLLVQGMVEGSVAPCDPVLTAQSLRCLVDAAAGLPHWQPHANSENVVDLMLRPALFGLFAGPRAPCAATGAGADHR